MKNRLQGLRLEVGRPVAVVQYGGGRNEEENRFLSLEGLTVQWWKQILSRSLQCVTRVQKGKDGGWAGDRKDCAQCSLGSGVLASISPLTGSESKGQ